MKIGYQFSHYTTIRNIKDKIPDMNYVVINDIFSRFHLIAKLINKIVGKELIFIKNLTFQYYDFDLYKVDIIHFFNCISYGKTPWVSTFETILPRFSDSIEFNQKSELGIDRSYRRITKAALKAVAGDACRGIIAMSESAASIQKAFLADISLYKNEIEEKLIILHPPQKLFVNQFTDKKINLDGPIHFIFVGNAFSRKGGQEILNVFIKTKHENEYDIQLTIVSSFVMDQYAAHETKKEYDEARKKIAENQSWIKLFQNIPNSEVIELMKKSHIGLLPTYADTYGYSVLEFQAAGCPVISTNVRALPEINNSDVGWIIEVPKNPLGEAKYLTYDDREVLSKSISTGLEQVVHKIFSDIAVIKVKSDLAIERIRQEHNPLEYGKKLMDIYKNGVKK